jgi:hypothetical protein
MEVRVPKKRVKPDPAGPPPQLPRQSDRITYRELRNTPGRVWERLASDEPLTLVADGETKAVVIPVNDGDAQGAIEAYRRGRAMMAVARIRRRARESGTSRTSLAETNAIIREVRKERAREARGK